MALTGFSRSYSLFTGRISDRYIHISLRAGLFLVILGILTWVTGSAFIFPSLGPTAYVLAFDEERSHSASVVIGGHGCGVIAGLASYYLIVHPFDLMGLGGVFSAPGAALGLGGVVAVVLTVLLMLFFNVSHPPACATTLIISLGILPSWIDGIIIIIAVGIMYAGYRLYHMLF